MTGTTRTATQQTHRNGQDTITMTTTTDRKTAEIMWAENLWSRLQKTFLDMEETLQTIIATQAWKPLGYDTFTQAWAEKMSGITLAGELRPHVVYAMFDEGATVEEIADTVKGVSIETVERLDEQKANGVPADMATTTTVRRHKRKLPGARKFIHIEIDADTHREWRHKAKAHNTTTNAIALAAVTAAFEAL